MAAALTKAHRHQQSSLRYLWKNSFKHPTPDPISAPKTIYQHKWYSRFPHSIYRKTKELDFPVSRVISNSGFSSRASSSSLSNSGLVSWYLGLVNTRPVATKSITAALIYTAADLTTQTFVVEASERYCLIRTLRMAGYGMLVLGPSLHFWFNFMSRAFPKRDLSSTFKKIALGQVVYGPAMTTIFFSVNAALQGESSTEIVARLKRDLLPTMINGIMYWPFCDFITFKFIPVHLQPLVSNSFSYLWTVYMTYMASLAKVSTEVKSQIPLESSSSEVVVTRSEEARIT